MKKIKSVWGYDIYEMSLSECKKWEYEYPCFAAVYEGETFEHYHEECSMGSLEELEEWCREYRC